MRLTSKPGDDARIVWMCAILVAVGGYYLVDTRYQQAIGTAGEVTQQLYERVAANERIVRQAARLGAVQAKVDADIARYQREHTPAARSSALLMMLAEQARRFNAQIIAVEPAAAEPVARETPRTLASPELGATDVTIRARARFRDLLNFVEDLSHHSVLLEVTDTQLSVASGMDSGGPSPALDATVHARLYRVRPGATTEGEPDAVAFGR